MEGSDVTPEFTPEYVNVFGGSIYKKANFHVADFCLGDTVSNPFPKSGSIQCLSPAVPG